MLATCTTKPLQVEKIQGKNMEMGTRYDHLAFDQEIKNFWDQHGVYAYTPDRTKNSL